MKANGMSGATLGLLVMLAGASHANAWEMPRVENDIFSAPPAAASAEGKPACAVVKAYIDLLNAGKLDNLGSLWAEGGVSRPPNGKTLHGVNEINAFYKEFFGGRVVQVVPLSFVADGHECVAELATKIAGAGHPDQFVLTVVDHFTVNDEGKVVQMIAYQRPQAPIGDLWSKPGPAH